MEEVYAKMGFPGCLGKRFLHCRDTSYSFKHDEFLIMMIDTGSVDGVHVHWARCPFKLQARHKGAKGVPTRFHSVHRCFVLRFVLRSNLTSELSDTTRSFNVTVDHRRFVQHISATLNDKTTVRTVRYDSHVTAVQRGLFKDFCFKVILFYHLFPVVMSHYLLSLYSLFQTEHIPGVLTSILGDQ